MSSASSPSSRWRAPARSASSRCGSPISSAPASIDSTIESFVFEMTGSTEKLNAFINLMEPLGLVDVSRTGVVAISRGAAQF